VDRFKYPRHTSYLYQNKGLEKPPCANWISSFPLTGASCRSRSPCFSSLFSAGASSNWLKCWTATDVPSFWFSVSVYWIYIPRSSGYTFVRCGVMSHQQQQFHHYHHHIHQVQSESQLERRNSPDLEQNRTRNTDRIGSSMDFRNLCQRIDVDSLRGELVGDLGDCSKV